MLTSNINLKNFRVGKIKNIKSFKNEKWFKKIKFFESLKPNYKYSYSSFRNNKDAVWFWDAAEYGQVPTKTLGPAPGSLAALVSPVIDAEDAVGMSVSFDMSQNFYYNYGGAYMEASRDNGVTWEYITKAKTSGKRYYGIVNTNYGNEIDPSYECWTRHDTNHIYSRNS